MRIAALAPFRQPVFRAIWTATLVSNFGSLIQMVGAAWMMTTLTHSATMVALVQASATLPIMLLSLFAGAIADSYDRRLIMLAAQLLMLVTSAALTMLSFSHLVTPWHLLLLTLLVGAGTSLNGPAWQASIRAQVPIEDVPAAVALNSIGFNLARSLGPAIGGGLMALYGPTANFAVNTLSYLGLIVVLLSWRPAAAAPRRQPLGRAIATGLRFAVNHPDVRHAVMRITVLGVLTASLWSLMPLVARDVLSGDQSVYGIILGLFGAGSIAGALLATEARQRFGNELLFGLATLGFAVGTLGVALAADWPAAAPFLLLAGAAWVSALSTINIVVQMAAPPAVIGRSLSIYQMAAFGGLAAGSYAWGGVAEAFGVRAALLASGVLLALSALLGRVAPLPRTAARAAED